MLFSRPEHWPRIHVVRCGVDHSFLDAPPARCVERPRLVSVGRLSPEKGQLLLVQAAALLRADGVDAEIVLVGDGPSRAAIEAEARRLGVAEQLRIVGWQGSAEVRRWLSESRAVVLPSFAEGIPVVLMEAMALGRPVIATYVGGIPELVSPGVNGWLVPAGAVDELARAMREALALPAAALDALGEAGRHRVRARHELSAEVGKLAHLCDGVLERTHADVASARTALGVHRKGNCP